MFRDSPKFHLVKFLAGCRNGKTRPVNKGGGGKKRDERLEVRYR